MRPSARRTDARRRRGFTLFEVVVATSVFALMIGIALGQLDDSATASRFASVQSDLRRIGQDVLARIAQDLRSTQSTLVGVAPGGRWNQAVVGDTIELTRISGYDPVSRVLVREKVGESPVFTRYTSTPTMLTDDAVESRRNQILQLWRWTKESGAVPLVDLTRELAPGGFQIKACNASNGFRDVNDHGRAVHHAFRGVTQDSLETLTLEPLNVIGLPLPGLPSSDRHFTDEPTLVAVRLVLRRRIGMSAQGEAYVTVHVETEVALRASEDY